MPLPSHEGIITMLTILICAVGVLLPDFTRLVAQIEIQSTIFALAFFCTLLYRLWLDSRVVMPRLTA
jgi:hypothetical protein